VLNEIKPWFNNIWQNFTRSCDRIWI